MYVLSKDSGTIRLCGEFSGDKRLKYILGNYLNLVWGWRVIP